MTNDMRQPYAPLLVQEGYYHDIFLALDTTAFTTYFDPRRNTHLGFLRLFTPRCLFAAFQLWTGRQTTTVGFAAFGVC